MCQHLKTIVNPYYNKQVYAQEHGNLVTVNRDLIDTQEYIQVPCGKCAECRKQRINEIIQRCLIESMFSYVFFVTLTYDDKHLPCITIDGEKFYYADYEHIHDMFDRFRKFHGKEIGRDFRYICVNEYGERKHRPHFHILLFVSKLQGDDNNTPHFLREIIYDNLGKYFAKNIGTKKYPIYEQYFTFKTIRSYGKVKSNYFVKYVESDNLYSIVNYSFVPKESDLKAIRYLVGYMNKPDRYEAKVEWLIDQYKDKDIELYKKYRNLLKSQCRYSKGLGCGFNNLTGTKEYLDVISVRCSSNSHVYTEIIDELPDSYDEFVKMYPSYNDELLKWRDRDFYQHFTSWTTCINGMDSEQYILHITYLKYFNDEFQERYGRFKRGLQPTISNLFTKCSTPIKYQPRAIRTVSPTDSVLYRYLRSMVEESIEKKLPFFAFKLVGQQSYTPMCKYYKRRCVTFDDTHRLFEAIGVSNYKEWLDLFERTINNKAAVIQQSNVIKYVNDDIIIKDIINENTQKNQYEILFTKNK